MTPEEIVGPIDDERPHFVPEDFLSYLRETGLDTAALGVAPRVVLTYVPHEAATAEAWDLEPSPQWIYRNPLYSRPGSTICLTKGPVGAPAAVGLLEELAALGARELWLLGYSGSLDPELPLGSVWAPDRAFPDEGTSRHYGAGDGPALPSPRLLDALVSTAPAVQQGAIWTTDAIYRETPTKIRRFQGQGARGVDMETSALFHVGRVLGVDVAALMVVSDELFHAWRPGFRDPAVDAGVRRAYDVLGAVLGVTGTDN